MKNLKILFVTSFLVIALVFAPVVSFAENNGNENHESKVKIETSAKLSNKTRSNSIWNRMFNWFGIRANAQIDTSLAPNISGITAPTVLKTGQVGTWKVKASDPEDGSLSYAVDWGEITTTTMATKMSSLAFVQESTFTHAYANPGKYTVKFTVENEAGLQTTSTTTVNVVGKVQKAPVISNLKAESKEPTKASIKWSTDARASTILWYSKTSPVDTEENPNIWRSAKIFNHVVNLKNLEPDTEYFVIVKSSNNGGSAQSEEISFTTPEILNDNAPVITSLEGDTDVTVGETTTVTVNAYNPKNGPLSYSADWGETMTMNKTALMVVPEPIFVQTATFEHVYTTPGVYTATFTAENETGLKDTSSIKITVKEVPEEDTTAPVVSGIASNTGSTSSTISWNTDELSTSKVFYSVGTPVDLNLALNVVNASMVTSHSLNITGLTTSTTYHYVVQSTDGSGNVKTSNEFAFTTSS